MPKLIQNSWGLLTSFSVLALFSVLSSIQHNSSGLIRQKPPSLFSICRSKIHCEIFITQEFFFIHTVGQNTQANSMTKPRQHTKATISDIPSVNYSQPFAVLATANRKLHFEELPDHREKLQIHSCAFF